MPRSVTGWEPGTIGGARVRRPGLGLPYLIALVAALVLGLLTLAAVPLGLFDRGSGSVAGPGSSTAAPQTPAPTTPPVPVPLLAAASSATVPTSAGIASALAPGLRDPAVGPRLSVTVVDVATGSTLYDRGGEDLVVPASAVKLVTGAAALSVLGATSRLRTRVVAGGDPAEVVLVGGGDPTLAGPVAAKPDYPPTARLRDLADALAVRLSAEGVRSLDRLVVDGGLFAVEGLAPGWKPTYLSTGQVATVTALMVDGGRVRPDRSRRYPDPDLAAGRALAGLLTERRVAVRSVVRGRAGPAAEELAGVDSPPVGALVERMVERSDNDLAEALGRHVALASSLPPTFAGSSAAVTRAATALGVGAGSLTLRDTSGLSRANRLRPAAIARLLARAAGAENPSLRPLLSGLPVGGFTGTLARRYRSGPATLAAGGVRAKTGTLDGVSTLVGVTVDTAGRLVAFALAAHAVPTGRGRSAEAALDRLAARLAGCGCR